VQNVTRAGVNKYKYLKYLESYIRINVSKSHGSVVALDWLVMMDVGYSGIRPVLNFVHFLSYYLFSKFFIFFPFYI
jgi:hypothetical protein